eukprot:COSAG02_NODE_170_length_31534_cov_33.568498_3_plen_168_part_00
MHIFCVHASVPAAVRFRKPVLFCLAVPEAIECMKMLAPYALSLSCHLVAPSALFLPLPGFTDIQTTGTNLYGSRSQRTAMTLSATGYAKASPCTAEQLTLANTASAHIFHMGAAVVVVSLCLRFESWITLILTRQLLRRSSLSGSASRREKWRKIRSSLSNSYRKMR